MNMRTSRISRETSRVVNALSPPKIHHGRSSLRSAARSGAGGVSIKESEKSESELSTPPSSPQPPESAKSNSLRKRKREALKEASINTTSNQASIASRRSPRKASTTDDLPKPKKTKRQPAKKIKSEDGSSVVEPPSNWEEVYNVTAEMRKRVLAPVDTMGCESLAEADRSPVDQRLQTLVSLMLSSQTKDTVTAVAMKNLQTGLPGGFCLDSLLKVEPEQLNKLIEKVGFHNNKTKFIKRVAEILRDSFDGDIPDTIEGLVSLPGVGPKMAYLCMSAAWGRDEGIGVDVHVHRITNLWRWHKTNTPEQTRAQLEAWLPKEKWHDINHLLVGLGQTICLPVGRKCGECDLATQGLCPSAVTKSPAKKRVKKEMKIEDGAVVKNEEMAVETDDSGFAVKIKEENGGEVDMNGSIGQVPDIEGIGAGTAKRLSRLVKKNVQ